jgi:Leucine-rich repeat (LRR) protein
VSSSNYFVLHYFFCKEFLNISRNQITADTFPTSFDSEELITFDASFNVINADFNISSFYGLINVENIHMAGCSIIASLPDDISELQNLITLDLDSNLFISGTIPASLGDIPSLSNIYLGSNLLEGFIPTELGQLLNLTNLELQLNSLTGVIPTELESLPNLVLNCEGNAIEGC